MDEGVETATQLCFVLCRGYRLVLLLEVVRHKRSVSLRSRFAQLSKKIAVFESGSTSRVMTAQTRKPSGHQSKSCKWPGVMFGHVDAPAASVVCSVRARRVTYRQEVRDVVCTEIAQQSEYIARRTDDS